MNQEKKLTDIINEEMIDNSLRDQDESTELDTEEKLGTAKSNEVTEFIKNS